MNAATSVDERTMEANFRDSVKRHDIAFAMSDDHSVWKRGIAERRLLEAHAKFLAPGRAREIFNAIVDEQFSPQSREMFYWAGQ